MLTLTDVSVRYAARDDGRDRASAPDAGVSGVSLTVAPGEVVAVLGPSGCGKSTLLRAVAGLEPLAGGTVAWDGRSLAGVPTHRRGFALLFQDGQLFGHRSVGANVGYALRLRRRPRAEVGARVAELLELVGLSGLEERMPATLSGGERQRVALARALATAPRLLLLDEPLSALDQLLRERLAVDLRTILRAAGTTALYVTHDHEEAFTVADRMALMRDGRIVQQGTLAEVWEHPVDAEAAAFLGYASVVSGPAADTLASASPALGALVDAFRGGPRTRDGADGGAAIALRRSALRVDPDGPLVGRVLEARLTPEATRLSVDVAGVGVLGAVAGGARSDAPAVGEDVRLRVDVARLAVVRIA